MMRANANPPRQYGITLIELMVALTISAILTAGAIQIFQSSRAGFRNNEALARVQENGRFSMDFLKKDVRGLGFGGCAQEPEVNSQLNSSASFDIDGPPIQGGEGTGINIITATGASDSLTLRGTTNKQNMNLSNNINSGENVQVQDPDPPVSNGDILMITDCENADAFQVTGNPSGSAITHNSGGGVTPGNNSDDFSTGYGDDANVLAAREATYRLATDADGNPHLERQINDEAPEVLVDNVVDMQLLYGVDPSSDNVPDAYLAADQVTTVGTWNDVVAVRARLTVRSNEQAIVADPVEIDFDGDGGTEAAPDNRFYQTFTTTIAIRNRLP